MGAAPSFTFIITTLFLITARANNHDDNGATSPTNQNSSPNDGESFNYETFRPRTIILVTILSISFFIIFLFLLYLKHCNGRNTVVTVNPNSQQRSIEAKRSGIDREVVESLPIFRFGSLRGQKKGLDCAVCLTRFEDPEVLRLLPKCKHAFHVECVDTWLDAHSTCPLCRYRVDPEDVVLLNDETVRKSPSQRFADEILEEESDIESQNGVARDVGFSGRHSIVSNAGNEEADTSSFRRKDMSLSTKDAEHRLEHRIIVSPSQGGDHTRWGDFEPSDVLYLTSEMITWNSRGRIIDNNNNNVGSENLRCVSEMTGMRRFGNGRRREEEGQRHETVVSRLFGWVSKSQPLPRR